MDTEEGAILVRSEEDEDGDEDLLEEVEAIEEDVEDVGGEAVEEGAVAVPFMKMESTSLIKRDGLMQANSLHFLMKLGKES